MEHQEEMNNPVWLVNGRVHEVKFAEEFLRQHEMVCCDGAFFSREGRVTDEHLLRRAIFKELRPYVASGVKPKVESILATMRLACSYKRLALDEKVIHVKNGTYHIDEGFVPEKQFCRHRLPVSFDWNAAPPETWLDFLDDLLSPMDIETLQEFMGYCLIPTTKAQKMLIITGRGGEGKSRIGIVMKAILGENMCLGSMAKLESNPFARADLEHMLLMVDDDMRMEALTSTNYIKSLITCELPTDLERKGEQSYQGMLNARFMAFGNASLRALHDRSRGFFRRQIILKALPRREDRVDDPDLADKLRKEADLIFMWCIKGLWRLQHNHYRFTISPEAEENLSRAERENNNIPEFLSSTGYVAFNYAASTTSKKLYEVYVQWCSDNALPPLSDRTVWSWLREHSLELNISHSHRVDIGGGKQVRGFRGIQALVQ